MADNELDARLKRLFFPPFFFDVSSCVADDELDARLRDMATKVPIYACEL